MLLYVQDSNLVQTYLSFDEKGYTLYVNYFTIIFFQDLSNMSIAKTNSSKFTLNNSIAKIKINEARSFLTCQLRKFVFRKFLPAKPLTFRQKLEYMK